ncbi:MAG: DinB family protein [Candidatus Kapaibacterium sp.]
MIATERGGKIGVLLYEYRRAINDLQLTISNLTTEQLTTVVDKSTLNPNCISIQAILTHVVACGQMYVGFIKTHRGTETPLPDKVYFTDSTEYIAALHTMYNDTVTLFNDIAEYEMDEYNPEKKIQAYWGQLYDYEQLMEHAIVHILRHRRQIERFIEHLQVSGTE